MEAQKEEGLTMSQLSDKFVIDPKPLPQVIEDETQRRLITEFKSNVRTMHPIVVVRDSGKLNTIEAAFKQKDK